MIQLGYFKFIVNAQTLSQVCGLSGTLNHDPSAALYIDGKLVAAAEEERFVRDNHAKNRLPYESEKFCIEQAGIKPEDILVEKIVVQYYG